MWIYPALLGILIPGDLWLIAPCPPPLLGRRAVIAILWLEPRGSDYRGFRFSHAPVLIISSTAERLAGCLGGQFSRHWSSS